MHMHIVPAVLVQRLTPAGALEPEPRLRSDPAGGVVEGGVVQLDPMKPDNAEHVGANRIADAGRDCTAAGSRHDPVGDLTVAFDEVEVPDADPSNEYVVSGHRPASAGLGRPTLTP